MKIVHASDLHVGSPLTTLEIYEGAPLALEGLRGTATLGALANLTDLCLAERADLLLVAGDLFDGKDRCYAHALVFLNELLRLHEAGVRVVWVRGNHDAESRMLWHLPLPDNASELGLSGPETLVLEELGVALHGVSYPEPHVTSDLSHGYPEPIPGLFNVGLLHTAAEGRPGHDPYAPCRTRALARRGYDYWALGHPHTPEIAARDPWIVFPGNLQGRHFRERGPRGAVVLEVADGEATVEQRALDLVRFEYCAVDAPSVAALDALAELVLRALARLVARAGERPLAVRLFLRGEGALRALLGEPVSVRLGALRRAAAEAARDGPGVLLDAVWVELDEPPGGLWRVDR